MTDNALVIDQKELFAAVVGSGSGAYLDTNTIGFANNLNIQGVRILLSTLDPTAWAALGNTRGFSLQVGGAQRDIKPQLATVTTIAHVGTSFQAAVNVAFGANVVTVRLTGTFLAQVPQ
jgi:hypothetical protein